MSTFKSVLPEKVEVSWAVLDGAVDNWTHLFVNHLVHFHVFDRKRFITGFARNQSVAYNTLIYIY